MYKQEEIKPYSSEGDKASQVEKMFDNIAPTYDTLNHRLSWNIDKYWRYTAIKTLDKYVTGNGTSILDVATGTGDLALQMAKKMPLANITGIDISEGMLEVARQKAEKEHLQLTFAKEDCNALSYPDNHFDAVTAAFGIRNFQNLEQGLAEMYRVLKPGGMFCVLELTTPVSFPMKQLFHIYSNLILPFYGKHISHDTSAYSYLNKTIEAFPQGETMMDILKKIGFSKTTFKRLTFGICTMYVAYK
jgi:demethylmenaquinone methyltransferase/2-methoxy-6-polyprenyl-1,4-benzoquinol methylase